MLNDSFACAAAYLDANDGYREAAECLRRACGVDDVRRSATRHDLISAARFLADDPSGKYDDAAEFLHEEADQRAIEEHGKMLAEVTGD